MTIREQLWERFPQVMRAEKNAWRWLASAKRSRSRETAAKAVYARARMDRIDCENRIRAEMGLPLVTFQKA